MTNYLSVIVYGKLPTDIKIAYQARPFSRNAETFLHTLPQTCGERENHLVQ